MQRHPSKISLAELSNSSRAANASHTHVIIHIEDNGKNVMKYILLPMKNLLDFGRPLKINDSVTYKLDMKNRRTQRGKIVVFGSEDECTEQLQILSAVADEDNIEISGTCDILDLPQLQENQPGSFHKKIDENSQHEQHSSVKLFKPRENKSTKVTSFDDDDECCTPNRMNPRDSPSDIDSNIIPWQRERSKRDTLEPNSVTRPNSSSITSKKIGNTLHNSNQKTLDKMLKKRVAIGKSSSPNSSTTFDNETQQSPVINRTIVTPRSDRSREAISTSLSSSTITPQNKTSNHSRECAMIDQDCAIIGGKKSADLSPMDIDPNVMDKDYITKEYGKIQRKHAELQSKYDKLISAYQNLKENSLPMPNESTRQWFLQIVKLIGPKSSVSSTEKIANDLGIDKPSELMSCISNTASNTTRQVIKLLYSPAERFSHRGKDVPQSTRKLIKEFVEKEHGPIENRPFREAINGVFRSHVHAEKKKAETSTSKRSNSVNSQINRPLIITSKNNHELSIRDQSCSEDDF